MTDMGVVLQELGRVAYSGPFTATAVGGASLAGELGDDALLASIADGGTIVTIAHAEPGRSLAAGRGRDAAAVVRLWRRRGPPPGARSVPGARRRGRRDRRCRARLRVRRGSPHRAGHDGRWRLSGRARSCRPPGARGRAVRRRRRTGACSRPASARAKPSGPAARRAGLGRSMRGAGGRCGDRSVFRRGRPAAGRGGRGEGRRRWGRRHDGRRGATGEGGSATRAARAAAPRPAAPPMRAAAEGPRGRSMTRRLISLITTVLWMFR